MHIFVPDDQPAEGTRYKWYVVSVVMRHKRYKCFTYLLTYDLQSVSGWEYTLQNSIDFAGESDSSSGFLRVGSSCEPASAGARVYFRFESCALKWRQLQLPLPPVGSGCMCMGAICMCMCTGAMCMCMCMCMVATCRLQVGAACQHSLTYRTD